MAKKKVKRRDHRRVSKRTAPVKRAKQIVNSSNTITNKIRVAFKNLLFFVLLTIIALVFLSLSTTVFYEKLFFILAVLLGFVSLAFVIALIVLGILKMMRK